MPSLFDAWFDVVSVAVQIYAIMDAPGAVPVLLALTEGMSREEVRRVVNKSGVYTVVIATVFTLFGRLILSVFGVSLESIRIGGGIILLYIAIDMLRGAVPSTRDVAAEDIAVVPLATPLLVGPGTLATIMVLTTVKPLHVVMAGTLIACFATYLTLLSGEKLLKFLGTTTLRAIGRFMSIIVAALAVEMIASGLKDMFSK